MKHLVRDRYSLVCLAEGQVSANTTIEGCILNHRLPGVRLNTGVSLNFKVEGTL